MQFIKALFLCIKYHFHQKDKGNKPYFFHPIHVMLHVKGYKAKVLALIHDLVEDTHLDFDYFEKKHFSPDIIEALKIMTRDKNMPYEDYIKKISANKLARLVKIEDLKHNMQLGRIKSPTPNDDSRIKKYEKSLAFLTNEYKK